MADFYLPSALNPSVVLPDCGVGYLDDFLNLPSSCRPAFLKGGFTVGRLPLRFPRFYPRTTSALRAPGVKLSPNFLPDWPR